jgi:hypothetical protein
MATRYTNQVWQPLRFYTALTEKLAYRHAVLKYHNIVPLIASSTALLPFEVVYPVATSLEVIPSVIDVNIYVVNSQTGVIRDISSNLTKLFGKREITPGDYEMYIAYPGLSVITALRQGIYYLHVVFMEGETNVYHWYSDDFRVAFCNTITFSFKNSSSFGNLWMHGYYWKASYKGINYDNGDFSEYSESSKTIDQYDRFTYRRKDKIHTTALLLDSNGLDALKMASMCDQVLITDELGLQNTIEIMEITPVPLGLSYFHNTVVKYRIMADSIISVNKQNISLFATQQGSLTIVHPVEESTGVTLHGEPIKLGGVPITLKK